MEGFLPGITRQTMVDVEQSELLVRFNTPGGIQFKGEGAIVPDSECVRAAARDISAQSQSNGAYIVRSAHL
jgi:hypothetical protein